MLFLHHGFAVSIVWYDWIQLTRNHSFLLFCWQKLYLVCFWYHFGFKRVVLMIKGYLCDVEQKSLVSQTFLFYFTSPSYCCLSCSSCCSHAVANSYIPRTQSLRRPLLWLCFFDQLRILFTLRGYYLLWKTKFKKTFGTKSGSS